ncbi:DUF2986 domain-containing protein [Vibrio ostreicida]|uniref:DUF2986 domain-containing protein n=1 Tax=Vibrio ostreicida TaxID=526588 RepID=A0ABT8BT96_9VIBR|nr:DUF2986 domain-containing protein [Vibrio ostreicida]MDN3609898.1 DUF2986 domain-containing protein [Vibrio ostreicida]NPD10017.1 DUF2986 domain-containing protein [Vibrio ostreicida]
MNRKKRINQILKTKLKKKNSKLHKSNKPRYVSKQEREKIEQEDIHTSDNALNESNLEEQLTPSQE